MTDIVYDARWSDLVDDKFRDDFLFLQQAVFHCGSVGEFNRQYFKNPYGKSILVVAYCCGEPVGARSFWRNDINGFESYQPGSTCVSLKYRGQGIFREMTIRALKMVPSNALVYNFPNPNSYPGYLKMGWNLHAEYSPRLYSSYQAYKSEHPQMMDDEYADWWVLGKRLFSLKIGDHYFLAHKDHRPLCYSIFAEVSFQTSTKFPRARLGFFFYRSNICKWYSRKFLKSHVVCQGSQIPYIPVWKVDAI